MTKLLLLTMFLLASVPVAALRAQSFGKFIGTPQTEWVDPEGRTMRLLADFTYEDQDGKRWTAPKGAPIDGASIPRIFWTLIGGPFEGRYRNASVVHDTECEQPHKNSWQDVHRMFYNASRAGGVSEAKAKVMYFAVYHFGPRWEWSGVQPPAAEELSTDDALRMIVLLRKNPGLSLDAVTAVNHSQLVNQVPDMELGEVRRLMEEHQRRRMEGESGYELMLFGR